MANNPKRLAYRSLEPSTLPPSRTVIDPDISSCSRTRFQLSSTAARSATVCPGLSNVQRMASKRTLDSFFQASPSKKAKTANDEPKHDASLQRPLDSIQADCSADSLLQPSEEPPSTHQTYAFPIVQLPIALAEALATTIPGHPGTPIANAPDLDLLYFQPLVPVAAAKALFTFLRSSLPFYRVKYSIRRGAYETEINTPRYTTVFGLDDSARFSSASDSVILDAKTSKPIPKGYYACRPRPIPDCLELLRRLTEAFTGAEYNFVLVNYYASGQDSISYHSDDEKFLGHEPTIASLSLGATRDFLMRHKPLARDARKDATAGIYGNRGTVGAAKVDAEELTEEEHAIRAAHKNPLKLPMAGGDMVLMRGRSQSHWLHSVPKRSGKGSDGGRINITFRKALVKGGTDNYYQYNVGRGSPMRWDAQRREMVEIEAGSAPESNHDSRISKNDVERGHLDGNER